MASNVPGATGTALCFAYSLSCEVAGWTVHPKDSEVSWVHYHIP